MTSPRRLRKPVRDPGRRGRDRGSLSIMTAIMLTAIILLVGLTVDGGGKMRADARADDLAEEAARAAGQAIDPRLAIPGEEIVVDRTAARIAVESYLAGQRDVAGHDVEFADDNRSIEVFVKIEYHTVVAGFFGKSTILVNGQGRAGLVHGISLPEAP